MSAAGGERLAPQRSTAQLRAAAAALVERRTIAEAGRGSVQPAGHTSHDTSASASVLAGNGPVVRVRAANGGAGASTMCLAMADAAADAAVRTRVIDAAAPAWSALCGASTTELGSDQGWRRGRRDEYVLIERVELAVDRVDQVPYPRVAAGLADLTILDAGWSSRELAAAGTDGWVGATSVDVDVVVTRPDEPALAQTETILAGLEERANTPLIGVVVVIVGADRSIGRDLALAGIRLRTIHAAGDVVVVPLLSQRLQRGLGADRLPKQLTRAARRLLDRIPFTTIAGSHAAPWPDTGSRNTP